MPAMPGTPTSCANRSSPSASTATDGQGHGKIARPRTPRDDRTIMAAMLSRPIAGLGSQSDRGQGRRQRGRGSVRAPLRTPDTAVMDEDVHELEALRALQLQQL